MALRLSAAAMARAYGAALDSCEAEIVAEALAGKPAGDYRVCSWMDSAMVWTRVVRYDESGRYDVLPDDGGCLPELASPLFYTANPLTRDELIALAAVGADPPEEDSRVGTTQDPSGSTHRPCGDAHELG